LDNISTISPPTNATSKGKTCIAFRRMPELIIDADYR
jgi:hypothetical protein